MDEIIKSALQQGLGYALFCFLLFYVLKKQDERDKKAEEREKNYQEIITDLTEKFSIINSISCKLDKVEDKIEEVLLRK